MINQFGLIKSYKINAEKSTLWGFNVSKQLKQNILEILLARWCKDTVKYLRIKICSSSEWMVEENINPIVKYIRDHCAIRQAYKLSWLGRVAVIKMVLLPKLILVFLNTILKIPYSMLNSIQAIINTFIWGHKKPRICLAIVEKRLQDGGVAIPNIRKYYDAAMLTACEKWWNMANNEASLILEQENSGGSLADWLVQKVPARSDIAQANWIVKSLSKIWLKYKKYLMPPYFRNVWNILILSFCTLGKSRIYKVQRSFDKKSIPVS